MFNFLSGGRARTSNSTRRTRQPAKRQRQATLERLEERRLLSLGVTWGSPLNGILTIKQTTGDNANVILNIHETNAAPSPSVQVDTLTGSAETLHFISGTVPVKEIDVCLNNGNDTVYLNGTVSTTTVFGIVVPTNGVPTVKMQLGTTNQGGNDQVFVGTDPNGTADGIQANLLQINGTASSSQGGNHGYNSDCVNVDNSNINSLSISLGDANSDCVYVDDSLINTSLSVTEGSGKCDVIEAGYYSKDVLGGSVTFSQGSGNYDEASVEDSIAVGSISITQGDGKNDTVTLDCGIENFGAEQYFNNVYISQGSGSIYAAGCDQQTGDTINVNWTWITSNMWLEQGEYYGETSPLPTNSSDPGTELGSNTINIATTSPVYVGYSTVILETGEYNQNNTIIMGGIAGPDSGSIDFETGYLDVYTGLGGGAYVQVENTQVDYGALGIFTLLTSDGNPYNITGGGGGNSAGIDNFSSLTVSIDPAFSQGYPI